MQRPLQHIRQASLRSGYSGVSPKVPRPVLGSPFCWMFDQCEFLGEGVFEAFVCHGLALSLCGTLLDSARLGLWLLISLQITLSNYKHSKSTK